MTETLLIEQIRNKKSFLCVGLDTDIQKIPKHLLDAEDPVFEFNKQIIDAVSDFCVAFKLNTAFYETLGSKGWESLQKTIDYIDDEQFVIADAKRGDIGNTSDMYARAFFDKMNADAVTVAPYMGEDSVTPFLKFKEKHVILLALTSNVGSRDFQFLKTETGEYLFERVIRQSLQWPGADRLMYVVGATQADMIKRIRNIIPDHFLLVPGIGTQGGSLEEVAKAGMNSRCGLLINASRSIIYAGSDRDFAQKAHEAAQALQRQTAECLEKYCL